MLMDRSCGQAERGTKSPASYRRAAGAANATGRGTRADRFVALRRRPAPLCRRPPGAASPTDRPRPGGDPEPGGPARPAMVVQRVDDRVERRRVPQAEGGVGASAADVQAEEAAG